MAFDSTEFQSDLRGVHSKHLGADHDLASDLFAEAFVKVLSGTATDEECEYVMKVLGLGN